MVIGTEARAELLINIVSRPIVNKYPGICQCLLAGRRAASRGRWHWARWRGILVPGFAESPFGCVLPADAEEINDIRRAEAEEDT